MSQREDVLKANHLIREGRTPLPTRMDWGYVGFRIPENDMKVLVKLFPGLGAVDAAEREAAWRLFNEHELANLYRVQHRSPNQVRRAVRLGNAGLMTK